MILDGFVSEWVAQSLRNGATWRKLEVHEGTEEEDRIPVLLVLPESKEQLEELKRLLEYASDG